MDPLAMMATGQLPPALFTYEGQLKGHRDWVTCVACPAVVPTAQAMPQGKRHTDPSAKLPFQVVSSSRDKTIVAWSVITASSLEEREQLGGKKKKKKSKKAASGGGDSSSDAGTTATSESGLSSSEATIAVPYKRLEGHGNFIECIALSPSADWVLSSSWDKTLRLWNLKTGDVISKFVGHTGDVLCVALSPGGKVVASGSRDKTVKLWSVRGECTFTSPESESHDGWVTDVKFVRTDGSAENDFVIATSGSDAKVKVWRFTVINSVVDGRVTATLDGHTGPVQSLTVSPDGSLCASGGKDGIIFLWDVSKEQVEKVFVIDCGTALNHIAFCPAHYWISAATAEGILLYDLDNHRTPMASLVPETNLKAKPQCTSLAWTPDGTALYSGFTDNTIREWGVHALPTS